MKNINIKKAVRDSYAKVATQSNSSCCGGSSCCGSKNNQSRAGEVGKMLGYSEDQLGSVPSGSNLGLGCGNPVALGEIKKGDVVLDLGSGAGFDAFLAARKTGDSGKVIGVDFTHEMIEKAKQNAKKGGYKNVEFLFGDIESLPEEISPDSVDIIISNDNKLLPIEIKIRNQIRAEDIKNIRKFMKHFNAPDAVVISKKHEEIKQFDSQRLFILPYWKYWSVHTTIQKIIGMPA